jgi:hypothetical protein
MRAYDLDTNLLDPTKWIQAHGPCPRARLLAGQKVERSIKSPVFLRPEYKAQNA